MKSADVEPAAEEATSPLRIDDRGGVRQITLNRPEARNAFNDELYDEVASALSSAARDDSIAVVLIAATGPVFSAGQDRGEMSRRRTKQEAATRGFIPFSRVLAAFDKPLIAVVQGPAVGVGFTMLLHCDFVLVSTAARFRTPFVSLGIVPEAGSSFLLPARIGPQVATDMLFTGRWMAAEEAFALGLASRLCAPEQLLDDAWELAVGVAASPREALVATKRLLLSARAEAVHAAMEREVGELVRVGRTNRGK